MLKSLVLDAAWRLAVAVCYCVLCVSTLVMEEGVCLSLKSDAHSLPEPPTASQGLSIIWIRTLFDPGVRHARMNVVGAFALGTVGIRHWRGTCGVEGYGRGCWHARSSLMGGYHEERCMPPSKAYPSLVFARTCRASPGQPTEMWVYVSGGLPKPCR